MTFTQEPSHERDVTRFDAILTTGLIAITRGGFDCQQRSKIDPFTPVEF
jgi:hypothetical protein